MTRLVVVRHGQTEWNRVERFRGQVDVPLNETGLRQAQAAARRIAATWTVSAVYHSPLQRTRLTAEAIATACHASLTPLAGLLDIDFGEWAGLTLEEAAARDGALLRVWRTQPHLAEVPGGERLEVVRARAFGSMERLAASHDDQTIVLVSHQVVCRLLVLAALGLDTSHFWRIQQETGTMNVFEWSGGVYTIVSVNDACHLEGA